MVHRQIRKVTPVPRFEGLPKGDTVTFVHSKWDGRAVSAYMAQVEEPNQNDHPRHLDQVRKDGDVKIVDE